MEREGPALHPFNIVNTTTNVRPSCISIVKIDSVFFNDYELTEGLFGVKMFKCLRK